MEKDKTIGAEKLVALFDSGTFAEVGAYLKRNDGDKTGVVCGYGAVNGKLVYAFAQDSDRQKGAFDAFQAKKIGMIYDAAMKNGAPVVGLFDSIGAYVGDGASALSAYGSLLANVSRASGVIPQIAVITGVCSGMAATAAAMFDLTVTVKETSKWFVNAPFLIGKDAGTAEAVAANGLSALTAESEADALGLSEIEEPKARRARLREQDGLSRLRAEFICAEKERADFFEDSVEDAAAKDAE